MSGLDYAARAGAILLGSREEVEFLGDAYTSVAHDPKAIEGLGDADLRELATEQANALTPHLWSRDKLVAWMDNCVRNLVERGPSYTVINQQLLRDSCFPPLDAVADIWE